MSTILLQLEAALADARTGLEAAAEKLHDTGVAHALAKSQYDAAGDLVKRFEGALNSIHGIGAPAAAPSAPVERAPPRKVREPEGPACPSCGDVGKLSYVMKGTMRFVVCSACNAEIPQ